MKKVIDQAGQKSTDPTGSGSSSLPESQISPDPDIHQSPLGLCHPPPQKKSADK